MTDPSRPARARPRAAIAVPPLLAAVAVVLGACAPGSPTAAPPGAHPSTTTAPPAPTTTTTTTVPPQPGWTVLATEPTGVAVDERTFTELDGASVTVIRFRAGQVRFALHDGSQDPPSTGITLPGGAGSAVSATEAPSLLAAFNGGFKVTAHAGGTEIDGQVLTPLVPGLASAALTATGSLSIGAWGTGFPPAGTAVTSVRQNLSLLVVGGQPVATATTWSDWGVTITGLQTVARSGLAQDRAGNVYYVASMNCLPIDIADAMVSAGAWTGMELDINPYWVQADVAPTPGGTLATAVPGQERPADQFTAGWTRDFFTVSAAPPPAG